MILHIKNMVCDRCKMAVERIFAEKKFSILSMELGLVEIEEELTELETEEIGEKLKSIGFELLHDKKIMAVQRIKDLIVKLVHYSEEELSVPLSAFLSAKLQQDYNTLGQLFSQSEGTTIEKYFIAQKIARVKELLADGELTISEIAFKMHYSSVAYLSNQFKKETGSTAGEYRTSQMHHRQNLDEV